MRNCASELAPAQWLYGYFALFPVTGFLATVAAQNFCTT
jgi:hypothetical protein